MKSDSWKQAEAKRLQGEIERVRAMKRAMAPKATASGWDDPTFGDRVLARAERYERLIGELDNPLPVEKPAGEQWEMLVAKIMEDEQLDKTAALKIARQRRPDLLEAMKRQANAKAGL